jgi:ferritin-like protein
MTIEEAKKKLESHKRDSEVFHEKFDELLEERLMELDPEFMKAMTVIYDNSGASRWYA